MTKLDDTRKRKEPRTVIEASGLGGKHHGFYVYLNHSTESHLLPKRRNYFITYKILMTNISGNKKKILPVMASSGNL